MPEETLNNKVDFSGEGFLKNVIESLTHPFCVIDVKDKTIQLANSAAKLGNICPGSTCYELLHNSKTPCKDNVEGCTIEEIKRTKQPVLLEHLHYDVQGNAHNVEIHAFPVFDSDGNVSQVIEYSLDITERKKLEQAFKESSERLQVLWDNARVGLLVIEASSRRIFDVNIVAARMIGIPKEQIIGKICHQFICPSQEHNCPICDLGQTADNSEKVLVRADGKQTPILKSVASVKLGGREYLLESFVDISERKNFEAERLRLNEALLKTNRRLKNLTLRDSHTGLYNHRYLIDIIEAEFYRSKRYNEPLSVMMLDIDYFKSINDVYGHQFGDLVLKQMAKQLKRAVRRYDIVVRFGGEEFIIVSPSTDRATALLLSKRFMDAVNSFSFGNKEHSVKIKLSIAVASYPEDEAKNGMQLVDAADKILNKVKEGGGSRIYSSLDITRLRTIKFKNKEKDNIEILKDKIVKLTSRANQSLVEAVFAFAKTIEAKDQYTGEHVEKTAYYATEIARMMNLSRQQIEHVRQAAALHDLGKIGISESILGKKAKLNSREFKKIIKHPEIGAEIIRPIHSLHPVIPLVLHHHERWDGKGYPSRLRKEEIPIGARIIAAADAYQALVSDRPYRKAFDRQKAIDILCRDSGGQFDPEVIEKFKKVLQQEKTL